MENNSNIDELVLQTLTENLQNINKNLLSIEEKLAKNSNAILYQDLNKITLKIIEIADNMSTQSIYVQALPKHNYSGLFTEVKESFNQFIDQMNGMMKDIRVTYKQKLIAVSVLAGLAIALITSIYWNIQLKNKLEPAIENDMKYRFMQVLGDDEQFKSVLLIDSIFKLYPFETIKKDVLDKEELIQKQVEAELRAKNAEKEASKFRNKADQLKKQIQ